MREAIESVLDNGIADIEIVVVDDASTDSTVAIVESIRHPAIHLVRNAQNLGVVATRRRGAALLRGRHVALLDQDDIAVAGRFEAQIDRLETAGGPDIVGGAIEYFGDRSGLKQFFAHDAEIRAALLFNASMAHPAVCMKGSLLRDGVIAYSIEAGPAADYALWVDAMIAGLRLENLDRVVTRYRRHAGSMTTAYIDQMIACARPLRRRVAGQYFPEFSEAERAALVNAISGRIDRVEDWHDAIYALARAALAAGEIPRIEPGLMVHLLSEHAARLIKEAVDQGMVDFAMLEMMTETNAAFEQWRALDHGALDRRIMALFG